LLRIDELSGNGDESIRVAIFTTFLRVTLAEWSA